MRPLKILHVEDNEEDVVLFGRACEVAGLPAIFHPVWDGLQAVAYLEGQGEFKDRHKYPLPDLIVLDLNLPKMGGFDFLKWLRKDSDFSAVPVLIFTISEKKEDKVRALAEGAAGYFVKPKDFQTLVQFAETVRRFNGNGHNKTDASNI